MPPNTVYVGRPTKWGNPYKLGQEGRDRQPMAREQVILAYDHWLKSRLATEPTFLDELKGKDLACFCPLDKPCHADVILKVLAEMEAQE
jgi:hypothetical protein